MMNRITFQKLAPAFALILLLSGCISRQLSCPDPDISIENMKATVQFLTVIQPARNHNNLGSMKIAAGYIAQKLKDHGLKPQEQKFVVSGKTYVNIIASVGPEQSSRLIVGAHYDVDGDQPGADDNASAVAGLLEVARFAKSHEKELPYRIDFVAYTLEEDPYCGTKQMGSYVHAESLHINNVSVKGMISLEMIGFFSDNENSQSYPLSIMKLFYPSKGNFIGVISNFGSSSFASQIADGIRNSAIDVRTLSAPSLLKGVDFSDHRNYWKFGYKAVMVTDTAFYRNPNYHEETDTINTLDFNKMSEVVKGVCCSILNIK